METTETKMLFDGVRGVAVKILNRVERTDAYLDKLISYELKNSDWNDLDKSLLNELVHGVLRWQLKLDWVINGFFHGSFSKSEVIVKNSLRIALYQILFLDKIPHHASVNEAVTFIKRIRGEKAANLVNAVLRNIIRSINQINYPDPKKDDVQYLSIMYSFPSWMVRRWKERFGYEETEKLLTANNIKPTLTIRLNTIKMKPDAMIEYLKNQNCEIERSKYLPQFIRCASLSSIGESELFKQGFVTVQDESAGLACTLLDVKPNETILDMCAAPGGKTTFFGEVMNNSGKIIAVDKYSERLKLVKDSCARLGLKNVETISADGKELQMELVDKILLDAPCSGLGVLSKKPDIKIKRDIENIRELAKLQTELLRHAATLIKPNGAIVYSTCTTEPEENMEIVKIFLDAHPEFKIDDAKNYVNAEVVNEFGAIETFPHRHGIDGSFAVRFIKQN